MVSVWHITSILPATVFLIVTLPPGTSLVCGFVVTLSNVAFDDHGAIVTVVSILSIVTRLIVSLVVVLDIPHAVSVKHKIGINI